MRFFAALRVDRGSRDVPPAPPKPDILLVNVKRVQELHSTLVLTFNGGDVKIIDESEIAYWELAEDHCGN